MTETRTPFPDPARLRDGHGAKWTAVDDDVIPAWVADMDLGVPEQVKNKIECTLRRGDLGYPFWRAVDPVVQAFSDRMRDQYGWEPETGDTRVFSDLIQILQVVIEYATQPGDAVALHVPTYPPFLAAIERAGRRIIPLPLDRDDNGWSIDIERHRQIFRDERPGLFILVNPHNPTGKIFRRDELTGLADLAVSHNVPVLSDEIHADLTFDGRRHIPFASLDSGVADLVITATSATKAFNLAGIRCAVAHIGHSAVADALDRAPLDFFGTPSIMSRLATVAAWRESAAWQRRTMEVLERNRRRITDWAQTHPEIGYVEPEATYLSWLDFSETTIGRDPAGIILEKGRVQLSPGEDFTQLTDLDTSSYARLNFATTPDNLDTVLSRIGKVLDR